MPTYRQALLGWVVGQGWGLEQPLRNLLCPTEASGILPTDILREETVTKFKSSESEIQLINFPSLLMGLKPYCPELEFQYYSFLPVTLDNDLYFSGPQFLHL